MYHRAKFYNRLIVKGELVLLKPLHIGRAGEDIYPGVTENQVLRDSSGRPFIPGSSLKGVLRSFTESLLYDEDGEKSKSCLSTSQPCLDKDEVKKIKEQWLKDPEQLFRKIYERLCPVCRTYGHQQFAGKVLFEDLDLIEETYPGVTEVRAGVAIERESGTAAEGKKFETEAVPAGTKFRFSLTAENLTAEEMGVLLLGLSALSRGEIYLGGMKSRGFGRVQLQEGRVTVIDGTEAYIDFLLRSEDEEEGKDLASFLREKEELILNLVR